MDDTNEVVGIPNIFTSTWRAVRNPLALLRIMIGWGVFSVGVSFLTAWESFYFAQYIEASSGFVRGSSLALLTDAYGIVIGIGGLAYMVAAILSGTLSDSIRTPLGQRIPFIIITTISCSLALFGAPIILERFEFGLLGFCLVVGLVHFFLGIGASPWNALLADLFNKQNRSWAALVNSTFSAAGVLFGLAIFEFIVKVPMPGDLSITTTMLSNVWYACAIVMIIAGSLSSLILTLSGAGVNSNTKLYGFWTNFKLLFSSLRRFGGDQFDEMFWIVVVWSFCNYVFDYFFFIYLDAQEFVSKFSKDTLIIFLIGLVIAAILSAVPSGWMAAKFGKVRIGIVSAVLNAIFFVTIGLLYVFYESVPFILLMGIFGGFGMTFLTTIIVSLPADLVEEGHEGLYFGLVRLAEGLALPFAVIIAGFFVYYVNQRYPGTGVGYSLIFVVAAGVWLVSILLLRRIGREEEIRNQE
ncbi:MAG: MFS transporter [Promethearchaeota archaeon]